MKYFIVMLLLTISVMGFCPNIPNLSEREKIDNMVLSMGAETGDPYLFHAMYTSMLWYESRFNQNCSSRNTNGSIDVGIAQLNSYCWKSFEQAFGKFDPYKLEENLYIGISLFKNLLTLYYGNYIKAIKAYNCGQGRVNRNSVPPSTSIYCSKVLARGSFVLSLRND